MAVLDSLDTLQALSRLNAKAYGAYYTDSHVAEFLANWAIRDLNDSVIDPSFGGGVFLRAASQRIRRLGGVPGNTVRGVELDSAIYHEIARELGKEYGLSNKQLFRANFFDLTSSDVTPAQAIIGNPPFIRYQRFSGDDRERAQKRVVEAGVSLSSLASSWAAFVVHSVSMLSPGGRLAMVVPMEISYASYARKVLEYLRLNFRRVTLLTFRKKLFQELNEDTVLLLADVRGAGNAEFYVRELEDGRVLRYLDFGRDYKIRDARPMDFEAISKGERRIVEHLIPESARLLYRALSLNDQVGPLGQFADVGIGYVTGANKFFHLTQETAKTWRIPERFIRPAVCRGASLKGVRFSSVDWNEGLPTGHTSFLLHIDKEARVPSQLSKYLDIGVKARVSEAYKCRSRDPWYSVPHVYEADAFLAVMSGGFPRMVVNEAKAVAPNSLHVVRVHEDFAGSGLLLSLLWQTSLTRLSVEIEGHSLGGGMLKLEPTEAERVLLPRLSLPSGEISSFAERVDTLLRTGRENDAVQLVDEIFLVRALGLSRRDCTILRDAAGFLMHRRQNRSVGY